MMKYQTKSLIIGRKKKVDSEGIYRQAFISLFDVNDPHKENVVPKEMIEIERAKRIDLSKFNAKFLLMGGDIVVNNLKWINVEVDEERGNVTVTGEQEE